MSRQIKEKNSVSISKEEASNRSTGQGKVLFTDYKQKKCALLLQNDRLTAAGFLSEEDSRVGAVYIGRIKDVAKNIDACFVEIADEKVCFLPLKKASFPYLLNRDFDGRLLQGDMLLVQIERDAQKNKQASVTAHISLSNDYFVISMGSQKVNFSTKLNGAQRENLKKEITYLFTEHEVMQDGRLILDDWKRILSVETCRTLEEEGILEQYFPPLPYATGCIVRTMAAEAADAEALLQQFFSLTEQYFRLLHTARYKNAPVCIKKAPNAAVAALNNLASPLEYQEIVTDDETLYSELFDYCSRPETFKPLRLYQDDLLSLAKLYAVESKVKAALDSRVWLKSGAYLVIEPTEALTVIDVNSGKYETGKNNEETAVTVNMEAAKEIALQLRLRNLSGIILVDFINMTAEASKKQVMSLLKRLLAQDLVTAKAVDMTPLGLVEITRKKVNKPLKEQMIVTSMGETHR